TGAFIAILTGWMLADDAQTYRTGVGEQRRVELADGSVVHLNSKSRVRVIYSDRARDFRLLEGEALFKVGHDAARPFRVRAGDNLIRALGTQFNVLRRPSGTTVQVIEGAVQVSTHADEKSPAAAQLARGDEARIDDAGHLKL